MVVYMHLPLFEENGIRTTYILFIHKLIYTYIIHSFFFLLRNRCIFNVTIHKKHYHLAGQVLTDWTQGKVGCIKTSLCSINYKNLTYFFLKWLNKNFFLPIHPTFLLFFQAIATSSKFKCYFTATIAREEWGGGPISNNVLTGLYKLQYFYWKNGALF